MKDKIFLITFSLFTVEAFIYYSIGKKKISIPPTIDIINVLLVIGAFSIANSLIINNLNKSYHEKKSS